MFKRKSECQKLDRILSPYIDEQLSPSERERIEVHIEGCAACRRQLESLRATVDLLHRVPMVSPPRSFTIAEVVPRKRAVAFGALRAATAVAVLLLAFLFMGDALNLFEAGPVEDRLTQQDSAATPTPLGGEGLDTEPELTEGGGYTWPVRQFELALVGVVVVLAGATAILWQRRRRGGEKALRN